MADWLTKEQRSRNMASIRSTGKKSTETQFLKILRAAKIWGWRRHPKLKGNPDFVFNEHRLAVFVDGCFWHGCPRCYKMPRDNRSYWKSKVESNRRRDRRNARLLRSLGWKVTRVWEHTLKTAIGRERVLASLRSGLGKDCAAGVPHSSVLNGGGCDVH